MKYTPEQRAEILARLLELRRQGKLNGVWYSDNMGVQIRTIAIGEPEYIPWSKAAELVGYVQAPAKADPRRPFHQPSKCGHRLVFRPLLRPMRKERNS